MGQDTSIEWTDATWNCIRGCSRVSRGCENCYAESVAARFSGPGLAYEGLARMGPNGPAWTRKVVLVPEHLDDPLRWTRPRRVFVNSMSDLFHEELSNETIAGIFGIMCAARKHTFQLLTKRAERMRDWFRWLHRQVETVNQGRVTPEAFQCVAYAQRMSEHPALRRIDDIDTTVWPRPNVWVGVSTEDQATAEKRIPALLDTPAAVRFVSAEPLLGPLRIADLDDGHGGVIKPLVGLHWEPTPKGLTVRKPRGPRLDWVIVGGESSRRARPFHLAWARHIVHACRESGVACFVKQLGSQPWDPFDGPPPGLIHLKSKKGGDPAEWPEDLRVRGFPEART